MTSLKAKPKPTFIARQVHETDLAEMAQVEHDAMLPQPLNSCYFYGHVALDEQEAFFRSVLRTKWSQPGGPGGIATDMPTRFLLATDALTGSIEGFVVWSIRIGGGGRDRRSSHESNNVNGIKTDHGCALNGTGNASETTGCQDDKHKKVNGSTDKHAISQQQREGATSPSSSDGAAVSMRDMELGVGRAILRPESQAWRPASDAMLGRLAQPYGRYVYVDKMYVRQRSQRRGVATLLWEEGPAKERFPLSEKKFVNGDSHSGEEHIVEEVDHRRYTGGTTSIPAIVTIAVGLARYFYESVGMKPMDRVVLDLARQKGEGAGYGDFWFTGFRMER